MREIVDQLRKIRQRKGNGKKVEILRDNQYPHCVPRMCKSAPGPWATSLDPADKKKFNLADQHRTFRLQATIMKGKIEKDNLGLLGIHPSRRSMKWAPKSVLCRSQRLVAHVMDDSSRKLKALGAEMNGQEDRCRNLRKENKRRRKITRTLGRSGVCGCANVQSELMLRWRPWGSGPIGYSCGIISNLRSMSPSRTESEKLKLQVIKFELD